MHACRQQQPGRSVVCYLLILLTLMLISQPASAQDETTLTGTVVSSTRNTLSVRSGTGLIQLFIFAREAERPASFPVGAQVRVVSTAGNEPGVRIANAV